MTSKNGRSSKTARSSYQSPSARAQRASAMAQSAFEDTTKADPYRSSAPYSSTDSHYTASSRPSVFSRKRRGRKAKADDVSAQPGSYTSAYERGTQGAEANSAYERQSAAAVYSRENPTYKARKSKRLNKVVLGVAIALVVVLAGAGAATALTNAYLNNINERLANNATKDAEEMAILNDSLKPIEATGFEEPFYLMLIGSDRRDDDPSMGQRSDTNIVVRVDPAENLLTMVSIPRDTKIELDDVGTSKFNAALNFGGIGSTIREASELLGVDISYYAEVNFEQMDALVDAIGGVDVYVDERIDDPDADGTSANPDWPRIILEEGENHLDGAAALCFARSRAFVDGDFTRTTNQRKLIKAILDKMLSLPITELPSAIENATSCVSTNLTVQELLTLAQLFSDGELKVYSAMVPSYAQYIGDISYVINDVDKTREMMEVVEAGGDPSGIVSDGIGSSEDQQYAYSTAFDDYDNTQYSQTYDQYYDPNYSGTYTDPNYTAPVDPGYDPNAGTTYDPNYDPNAGTTYDPNYDPNAGTTYDPNYDPNTGVTTDPSGGVYDPGYDTTYDPSYDANAGTGGDAGAGDGSWTGDATAVPSVDGY